MTINIKMIDVFVLIVKEMNLLTDFIHLTKGYFGVPLRDVIKQYRLSLSSQVGLVST